MPSLQFTRRLVGIGCVAASLLGASAGASAQTISNGNRLLTVTAERQGETTSYTGSGSFNFVSFRITVSNVGGNTINNIVLRAQSRVLPASASDTDPTGWVPSGVTAPFDSATTTSCTAPAGSDLVTCGIGQLRAAGQAGSSSSFIVFYASPTRTGDPGFPEEVNLRWSASYSDASNGERVDSGSGIANAPTAIDAFGQLRDEFKSAVPLAGATLSTGSVDGDGLPQPTDPWTTTVRVPGAVADYKQARGTEFKDGILESPDLKDRRITELVIPDTSYAPNRLVITLRRDFSTIQKGSRITNAKIFYTKTLAPVDPSFAADRAEVVLCSSIRFPTGPNGIYPANGPYLDATGVLRPCIRSRTSVPNRKVVNGKSEGYWEWVIEAYENGRYIN